MKENGGALENKHMPFEEVAVKIPSKRKQWVRLFSLLGIVMVLSASLPGQVALAADECCVRCGGFRVCWNVVACDNWACFCDSEGDPVLWCQ